MIFSAFTGKSRNDIVQPLGSPPGSVGVSPLPPGTLSPLGPSMGPVHSGQVGGPHPPLSASPSPTNNNIINFNNKQPASGKLRSKRILLSDFDKDHYRPILSNQLHEEFLEQTRHVSLYKVPFVAVNVCKMLWMSYTTLLISCNFLETSTGL